MERCVLPIPGYPGYFVSNYGEVYTAWRKGKGGIGQGRGVFSIGPSMKRMKASPSDTRMVVGIGRNYDRKVFKIASLVLMAFVGPRPAGMQACHFPDRSPLNNRLDNLRWDTHKSNQADRISHGTTNDGERNGSAKLKASQVIKIRELRSSGITYKNLAGRFGVSLAAIQMICERKTWRTI